MIRKEAFARVATLLRKRGEGLEVVYDWVFADRRLPELA
jgi:GTP1/Obg family GTP-binding protein